MSFMQTCRYEYTTGCVAKTGCRHKLIIHKLLWTLWSNYHSNDRLNPRFEPRLYTRQRSHSLTTTPPRLPVIAVICIYYMRSSSIKKIRGEGWRTVVLVEYDFIYISCLTLTWTNHNCGAREAKIFNCFFTSGLFFLLLDRQNFEKTKRSIVLFSNIGPRRHI